MKVIQPSLSRHAGTHRGGMSWKQYMRRYGTLYIMLLLPVILAASGRFTRL